MLRQPVRMPRMKHTSSTGTSQYQSHTRSHYRAQTKDRCSGHVRKDEKNDDDDDTEHPSDTSEIDISASSAHGELKRRVKGS